MEPTGVLPAFSPLKKAGASSGFESGQVNFRLRMAAVQSVDNRTQDVRFSISPCTLYENRSRYSALQVSCATEMHTRIES